MQRHANAMWSGDLKSGSGVITADSGVLDHTPYSFRTRFEDQKGTNPEELIAAAHAGCFSMALSNELASAGMTPDSVGTRASVRLDMTDQGPSITAVSLTVHAKVPGADKAKFDELAEKAKRNCPVSKVLNAEITMTATLED